MYITTVLILNYYITSFNAKLCYIIYIALNIIYYTLSLHRVPICLQNPWVCDVSYASVTCIYWQIICQIN